MPLSCIEDELLEQFDLFVPLCVANPVAARLRFMIMITTTVERRSFKHFQSASSLMASPANNAVQLSAAMRIALSRMLPKN
jgi:hypothetical protein